MIFMMEFYKKWDSIVDFNHLTSNWFERVLEILSFCNANSRKRSTHTTGPTWCVQAECALVEITLTHYSCALPFIDESSWWPYTALAVWGGNRTQLSYLWKRDKLSWFIVIFVREFVLVFCNKDWLIFNCWWTKRISEALQPQEARSGQFWLGSNNFLLHPGSGRIIRLPESGSGTLRHSGAPVGCFITTFYGR